MASSTCSELGVKPQTPLTDENYSNDSFDDNKDIGIVFIALLVVGG